MKTTIIVEAVFRQGFEVHFPEYSARVRQYLEKHGRQVIRRQRVERTLYGDNQPDLVMMIDFPDRDVAERIFFAPEYLGIIPLRDKVFSRFAMYLAPFGDI
jgi:uncharacterized protein (DUF1330 family)